jgi:hypothetical protein
MARSDLDKAELAGFFLESLFYGVLFTLYGFTVWILSKKRNGRLNVPLLLSSTAMFLFSTVVSTVVDLIC